MNPVNLSYYVIEHCKGTTPMKLQKLLYYLKVWGIVSGKDIVDGDFVKWKFGPVNKDVYYEFKKYASSQIPPQGLPKVDLSLADKEFVDFVLECYGPYNALTLSSMTHLEGPWQQTGPDKTISEKAIKSYYSSLPFAKNFPVDPAKPFYPVQTNMYHAFILDMVKHEAEKSVVYPSFADYKKQVAEAKQQSMALLEKLGKQ